LVLFYKQKRFKLRTYCECLQSWRGRGQALWLRRWCGMDWHIDLDEDNPEIFPASHHLYSPREQPWTGSLGPGQGATPRK